MTEQSAASRWARELAEWAIPEDILAAAPESPWSFPAAIFAAPELPSYTDTPAQRRAREAFPPDGGTVLDVGAGGGAASLPLVPPARRIVAVDELAELLAVFASRAEEVGVEHEEVQGSWPAVAGQAPVADVVVSNHVFYNVPDLAAFATALTDHARWRVVVEITAAHPLVSLNPLWMHFHGLERPSGPTAEDALAVLSEAGIAAEIEWAERPPRRAVARADRVAFVRRRLCLAPDRDPEIEALIDEQPELPGKVAVLWWPGTGGEER